MPPARAQVTSPCRAPRAIRRSASRPASRSSPSRWSSTGHSFRRASARRALPACSSRRWPAQDHPCGWAPPSRRRAPPVARLVLREPSFIPKGPFRLTCLGTSPAGTAGLGVKAADDQSLLDGDYDDRPGGLHAGLHGVLRHGAADDTPDQLTRDRAAAPRTVPGCAWIPTSATAPCGARRAGSRRACEPPTARSPSA